jgi:CubicO group peptidase (beta-lactamase class C family)
MSLHLPGISRFFLPLGLLLGACLSGQAPDSPTPSASHTDTAALMAEAHIPGLSLARIHDGEIASVESLGLANADSGDPVTADTLFEAASLSKPVFATIVLRWAERGALDLDQPLLDLLPNPRIDHDPRAHAITARLVLSHQTGLPNWGGDRLELLFDPGTEFSYSGEGYVYLQHVLEKLSGESLDTLARREVFEPLGMHRSRFDWPEPPPEGEPFPVAVQHDEVGKAKPPPIESEQNAAASLLTTAAEYARFVIAWMDHELLSEATVREALAPAVRMRGAEHGPRPPEVYERIAWGLGWGLILPQGIAWHWGDNDDTKGFVAFDPSRRDGIVYFANSTNGLAIGEALCRPVIGDIGVAFAWNGYDSIDSPGFSERLEGAAAEAEGRYADAIAAFERVVELAPRDEETATRARWLGDLLEVREHPVALPTGLAERYAGQYQDRRLFIEQGELRYQRGERSAFRLIPLSETLFALENLPTFRLEVVLDKRGEAVKLVGHSLNGSDESPRGETQ